MIEQDEIIAKFTKAKDDYLSKLKEGESSVYEYEFDYKGFTCGICYEDEETVHYYVSHIKSKSETYELPESVCNNLTEYGDVYYLDEFLYYIDEGNYDWIKSLYTDLTKIHKKYIADLQVNESVFIGMITALLPTE